MSISQEKYKMEFVELKESKMKKKNTLARKAAG